MTEMAAPAVRRRYAALARARAREFTPGPVGAALLRLIEQLPPRRRGRRRR